MIVVIFLINKAKLDEASPKLLDEVINLLCQVVNVFIRKDRNKFEGEITFNINNQLPGWTIKFLQTLRFKLWKLL